MNDNSSEKIIEIKKFWDERANSFGKKWNATLGEKYLRRLEMKTITKLLRKYMPQTVLDVGCGNGYSTKKYAESFPDISFIGVDYSEKMIQKAKETQLVNCKFVVADVTKPQSIPGSNYDIILTQRCIQNLGSYENQYLAIKHLLKKKKSDGLLLLMECSKDGVEQLNRTRKTFLKKPKENIEPWHNNFLRDEIIINDFNAKIVFFSSTYMFFTKVIHPKLDKYCYVLPNIGKFGYDRLYIIK